MHVWMVGIIGTVAVVVVWYIRLCRCDGEQYVSRRQCTRLILGCALLGSLPWVSMAVFMFTGAAIRWMQYLNLYDRTTVTAVWRLILGVLWAVVLIWMHRYDGAATMAKCPGILPLRYSTRKAIVILTWVGFAGCVLAVLAVTYLNRDATHAEGTQLQATTVYLLYGDIVRTVAWAALFLGIGMAGLLWCVRSIKRLGLPRWWNSQEAVAPGVGLGMSVLWLATSAAGFGYVLFAEAFPAARAYVNGDVATLEGHVRVLQSEDAVGEGGDKVEVGGQRFRIKYSMGIGVGYSETIVQGGALQEGRHVRVWHRDGKILRLDVLDE